MSGRVGNAIYLVASQVNRDLHRIPSGAGRRRYNGSIPRRQGIQQGALAGVGAPDYCNLDARPDQLTPPAAALASNAVHSFCPAAHGGELFDTSQQPRASQVIHL